MTSFCVRCAETIVNPEEPCGFCVGERRLEAVTTLVSAAGSGGDAALLARVDAIDTLRNLGHSPDEVLMARARALDGHSVQDIVDGLIADERLAVTA